MPADILFDLDGTLIDSSPGILASFRRMLDAGGLRAAVPLEPSLIGPPLGETLKRITGIEDEAALAGLIETFKRDYDNAGFLQTLVFEGVAEGLARLAAAGSRLFIVTNKRLLPTRKILDTFGLAGYFTGVHTRDETTPMAPSKSAVTRHVIARYAITPGNAFFVGDSEEDAAAARDNHLRFILAKYGYGHIAGTITEGQSALRQFQALPELISRLSPKRSCY